MTSAAAIIEATIHRVENCANGSVSTDSLAIEEPLEIRLGFQSNGKIEHQAVSITMRTPGHDAELAAGFLFTEGIVETAEQVLRIKHCGPSHNTIRVDVSEVAAVDLKRLERHFYTTSSCGVCGKTSIDALRTGGVKMSDKLNPRVEAAVINSLPESLRAAQNVFDRTGGLHASALFKSNGELDIVREDVGRHNALDKTIGAKLLQRQLPLSEHLLLVSGRASFELVQKAVMAGIPVLAAVGAPSSLAVELAAEFGMTLIGFTRDDRFNIYCGAERVRTRRAGTAGRRL